MHRDEGANLHARRRSRQGGLGVVLCLLAMSWGCADPGGGASPEEAPSLPADTTMPPIPGANRPDSVQGVLNLEGSREPMTYRIFRSPEGYPLAFSTYVPADMEVEEAGSGREAEVRFLAAFGGVRNAEMLVSARFPRESLSTEQARARVREIADSLGRAEPGESERYPWALEWYRIDGEGTSVGAVALGRHRDRFFFVITRYPADAGDGFEPRAKRVLDEWRWSEGGGLGT